MNQRPPDYIIPPSGYAAIACDPGWCLALTDMNGTQVPDLIAISRNDYREKLSMANTRQITARWSLELGMSLYSTSGNPMLRLVEDTVGVHAMLGGYCNRGANIRRFGSQAEGPTCEANLIAAMEALDVPGCHVQPDMCVCPWMEFRHENNGQRTFVRTASEAGDYSVFEILAPLVVAISACPQTRSSPDALQPINGRGPSRIGLNLYRGAEDPVAASVVIHEAA